MPYTAPTNRHGHSAAEHNAYLSGHERGWDHANYVAAYGAEGVTDTEPPAGLSAAELMYWRDGYLDGVEQREADDDAPDDDASDDTPGTLRVREWMHLAHATDADAIAAEISALTGDDVISDGCARTIASRWAVGSRSPLTALSTTGTITDDVAERIEFEHSIAVVADRPELAALLAYVRRRGTRGPVTGWFAVWVR